MSRYTAIPMIVPACNGVGVGDPIHLVLITTTCIMQSGHESDCPCRWQFMAGYTILEKRTGHLRRWDGGELARV